MPQTDFFLCREERINLANFIFSNGLIMIPDLNYETKDAKVLHNINDFIPFVDKNEIMFIVSPEIDMSSFVFGECEKDGKTYYYIRQKYGLPTIDFLYAGITEISDNKICPGSMSLHAFIYGDNGNKIYPSVHLQDKYKILCDFLKEQSIRLKLTKRTFWIGKKSILLCKSGDYDFINIGDVVIKDIVV